LPFKWVRECRSPSGLPGEDFQIEVSAKPIAVAEAYEHAAIRHWRDGILLESAGKPHYANADQLFGFAAECAIKKALCRLPGFAPDGELSPDYHIHINKLWNRIAIQGLQKQFPNLMALLKFENPFHDWSTNQRYEGDDAVTDDAFKRHRDMAKRLLGSVGIRGSHAGG
jgi:hypothetical protein